MCGILGIFDSPLKPSLLREKLIRCSSRLRHRGPDWSGYMTIEKVNENLTTALGHERLAIIDPESGAQPICDLSGEIVVAANGEIYNYKELYGSLEEPYTPSTGSDCEVIIPLYKQYGTNFMNMLRGMFSIILYDKRDGSFFAFRDHIGKTPMYIGWAEDGSTWIASEMKALSDACVNFRLFPPGHSYSSKKREFELYYKPMWKEIVQPKNKFNPELLRNAFIKAVERRMMSDVPWGVLLSGGLDSSLVASIASRIQKQRGGPPLHSYCIGLESSPDLKAAAIVAKQVGTIHNSFTYTVQEGLDVLPEVIYHLETYDVTTIRASTPMYLMSRKIKAQGIKMVLSGEGADEIFGGYLYFHKAPNATEFQAELKDKINALNLFDCLRANKSTSAWGIELRTPFLDADFIDDAMNIDPEEKMIRKWPKENKKRIEKWILRKAFDTPDNPFLNSDILWRQKEQFSDGVGYGWIDSLRDHAEQHVTDKMFETRNYRFPFNTPATKEAYYYRAIFESHYPQPSSIATVPGGPSIACSTARAMQWDKTFSNRADCSGRAVMGVHDSSYDEKFHIAASVSTNTLVSVESDDSCSINQQPSKKQKNEN